ncbi:Urease accessory protein UreF [Bhargavaea cecembensis DSE10]|uniref:Urease accessory protein UreF n=1 Tax=Bhargavaea cecembensis DSE10 TaxID=1235279 RepID=M7P1E0_9BACL|nr:urease accessory protein UreF [Bhargavaea cecembensis]EMR07710.1 Urease accessory protein UreF [Bhargavaea cecembensis DSE10]
MTERLLALFQLCDSNLPTGSFSHSFGLETYIQDNTVTDSESFEEWLSCYLEEQLAYTDGIACRMVYDALETGDLDTVSAIGARLHVQNLPRETRQGTRMIGEGMLKLFSRLYDFPFLNEYAKLVKEKRAVPHPAVVFAITAHGLGCSREEAVLYHFYGTVSGLIQNAVRAIPLGQTAGQMILNRIRPLLRQTAEKALALPDEDFGLVAPGLELSQMQHERVNVRIFMS